jgi:uncharacterized protein
MFNKMKSSKYNTFFPSEDKIIGYNSFNNDFIIFDTDLYNVFLKKNNNIGELKEIHTELYDCLVEKGFIVDSNVDELQKVKDLVYSIDNQNDTFHVIINPTMNCNFKCWYCYETLVKSSKMDEATIQKVKTFISNTLNKGFKSFALSFFGGEPMLYFEKTVLPILKLAYSLAKEKGIYFSSDFTTNGFLINENLLEKCKQNGVLSFQITLDGWRDRHNKVRFVSGNRGSYSEIVNNIKLCLKNKMSVNVRINISNETLSEDTGKIMEDFKDISEAEREYLTFSFHKVWQEKIDMHKEISNLISSFQEKNYRTLYNKNTDTVRESCYADKKNQATINYNGDLFKCTARDFKTENREGYLDENGNPVWNEKYEARMNTKFKNPSCLECKILPICNGGCSQNYLENTGKDFCVHDFNEEKMLDVVKNKFFLCIS